MAIETAPRTEVLPAQELGKRVYGLLSAELAPNIARDPGFQKQTANDWFTKPAGYQDKETNLGNIDRSVTFETESGNNYVIDFNRRKLMRPIKDTEIHGQRAWEMQEYIRIDFKVVKFENGVAVNVDVIEMSSEWVHDLTVEHDAQKEFISGAISVSGKENNSPEAFNEVPRILSDFYPHINI